MKIAQVVTLFIWISMIATFARGELLITQDTVQNGGVLTTTGDTYMMIQGASNPTMTLTNGATTVNIWTAIVGGASTDGDGQFVIEGGSVFNTTATNGSAYDTSVGYAYGRSHYLGYQFGATGEATVRGANSRWVTNGEMYVGFYGEGILNIESGGEVSSGSKLSFHEGSSSQVRVTGAEAKYFGSGISIGYRGSSSMVIDNGGFVRGVETTIAQTDTSSGSVIVRGAGSKMVVPHEFRVGWGGDADLLIENGGLVETTGTLLSSWKPLIAIDPESSGKVTVRGADSKLRSTNGMSLAGGGNGTLVVENGGFVDVTGSIDIAGGSNANGNVMIVGASSCLTATGSISLASSGTGSFVANEGAQVGCWRVSSAYSAGSAATFQLSDAQTNWNITTSLEIGRRGHAEMVVETGASVRVMGPDNYGGIDLGTYAGSDGELRVRGLGSLVYTADPLNVGHDGVGRLVVENGGTVSVAAPLTIGSNSLIDVSGGSLTDENGNDAGPVSGLGKLRVRNGSNVSFESIRVAQIEVTNDATLKITSGGGDIGTSKVSTIWLSADGHFDIADHGLIVTDMTELQVNTLVANGYNSGAWNGADGIGSSAAANNANALGVAPAGSIGTWRGQSVAPDDLLVAVTIFGDSNLDNVVNFSDLLVVAQNYVTTSGAVWSSGDFTYDGQVNFTDLLAVAQSYGLSALSDGSIIIDQSLHSRFDSDWQLALASIPEPSSLMLLGASTLILRRRNK